MPNGDNEIKSKNKRSTEYEFTIELIEKNPNIQAKITLRVKELQGDYTELKGTKTITIPVNKNITSIDLNPMSCTKKGKIRGKSHAWNHVPTRDCAFLNTVYIIIDSSSRDDRRQIGIKGNFDIPIHYKR